MHRNQTVEFVEKQRAEWLNFGKGEFTVMEMIDVLDSLVDDSGPDNDLPSSIHDFQTAERIREKCPDHDWFHLVGLLHDGGKVLACLLWETPSLLDVHLQTIYRLWGELF